MMAQKFCLLIILIICSEAWSQTLPAPIVPDSPTSSLIQANSPIEELKPNGKRIRRQLNLIVAVDHDEEFLIPDREITIGGRTDFFEIKRIKGTDYFRISPKKAGNGITTLIDKVTGQILVEIRFDIRDDSIEKTLREIQTMLTDIEGIEFKILNGLVVIDGYVLLPRDLIRIYQVINAYDPARVKSLVTLSPVARQKIANFISNDVNNPEVKVTAVGDYIKLEGQVNSIAEKDRIVQIVSLYIPDIVTEVAPNSDIVKIQGRKTGDIKTMIIDLITIKKDDEKVDPPPKMIQIVTHFVKISDNYSKNFKFNFSPAVSAQTGLNPPAGGQSTIGTTIDLLNNLLPKLNWAKTHGFAKILDTASVLVQDKLTGSINRTIATLSAPKLTNGQLTQDPIVATVSLVVTPTIKAERSGLVELKNLNVTVDAPGKSEGQNKTTVTTTISVRDRQSAAFGGIIKKSQDTVFGSPATPNAIITFESSKGFDRVNSQFVVFVTPIIKSSASSGVDQVKKKFRIRD
jgi:pilus assembly protein CpaC